MTTDQRLCGLAVAVNPVACGRILAVARGCGLAVAVARGGGACGRIVAVVRGGGACGGWVASQAEGRCEHGYGHGHVACQRRPARLHDDGHRGD